MAGIRMDAASRLISRSLISNRHHPSIMSLVSLAVGPNNPVTMETLNSTLERLGVSLKPEEMADYKALLAGAHETYEKVLAMPDYVPKVDEERFPRENVHFPAAADNPANAWAWRVSVQDRKPAGLLAGKTICLKGMLLIIRCLLLSTAELKLLRKTTSP